MIKVITGIRRCGKSCLMQTIAEELRESGIPEENIVSINPDKRGFRSVKTADRKRHDPAPERHHPREHRPLHAGRKTVLISIAATIGG
ncbi:MAG: AAA family ATPase [Clostridia bacterium]|nr:AAA family ATPase [Clostridia bacterium]